MEKIKPLNLLKWWQYQLNKVKFDRTYILPTLLGIYYTLLCFVLLAIAFIYNNNIAYISCFALVSLGITSLFQTNFNMERIKITLLPMGEVHAEHPYTLRFLVENTSNQASHQLLLTLENTESVQTQTDSEMKNTSGHFLKTQGSVISEKLVELIQSQKEIQYLAPKETREVEFSILFKKRGFQTLPSLVAETTFPFGLFRSWKSKISRESLLIYPAKKGILPLPLIGTNNSGDQTLNHYHHQRGNDFYGHRSFQRNDSFRHIDWKAYARNQKLNIKLFDSEFQRAQAISWNQTQTLADTESRISQMAQWISICEKQKRNFVLEMPDWSLATVNASSPISQCYEYLALFRNNESSPNRFSSLPFKHKIVHYKDKLHKTLRTLRQRIRV